MQLVVSSVRTRLVTTWQICAQPTEPSGRSWGSFISS